MQSVAAQQGLLSEIVRRLVDQIDPDKIILFGSRARGQRHSESDVDLLIVKASQEPRHKRVGRAHRALIGVGIPVDILWYTPEEAAARARVRQHVASRALREGQILYERES
ncbi:MAG: nucleotidyltransferase domain-containing protein [Acidobacteria bacterium]|nr:nucleotidyltransferase domain-containing protein [Acidobacteriota bacterium]